MSQKLNNINYELTANYVSKENPTTYNDTNPYIAREEVNTFENKDTAISIRERHNVIKNNIYRSDTFLESLSSYTNDTIVKTINDLIDNQNELLDITNTLSSDCADLKSSVYNLNQDIEELKSNHLSKERILGSSIKDNNITPSVEAAFMSDYSVCRIISSTQETITQVRFRFGRFMEYVRSNSDTHNKSIKFLISFPKAMGAQYSGDFCPEIVLENIEGAPPTVIKIPFTGISINNICIDIMTLREKVYISNISIS